MIVVIVQFLCIAINCKFQQFVNGKLIPEKMGNDGRRLEFEDTGYSLLHAGNITGHRVVAPAMAILRKIACPNPNNSLELIAIDCQRKNAVVPFHAVDGDMVLINGTDPKPWLRKIVRSHLAAGDDMAKITFYIKSGQKEECSTGVVFDIYMSERNTGDVHWNSILGMADGHSAGDSWEVPVLYLHTICS